MRYRWYMKFNEAIPEDEIISLIKVNYKNFYSKELDRGFRLMGIKDMMPGMDGDDFVTQRVTVVITTERFKIPRIIKNHLKQLKCQ